MDLIVTGTVAMEQAALQQVRLPRAGGLVHAHRQIIVALAIRAPHSGDHVPVATAHIGRPSFPLEYVDAWQSHMADTIAPV